VKLARSLCPDVRSVTLICATCVGAFVLAFKTTAAVPVESESTVSVLARGWAGLLVTIA
jgi:hypothetical protein